MCKYAVPLERGGGDYIESMLNVLGGKVHDAHPKEKYAYAGSKFRFTRRYGLGMAVGE